MESQAPGEARVLTPYAKNRPCPSLEDYVAQQVAATRMDMARRKEHFGDFDDRGGADRLARSEKYARWRWNGYADGEIGSL